MKRTSSVLMAALALAGVAKAGNVDVNANISTSTTWTSNNVYHLKHQIYVLPGATLTIEAGTVVSSFAADQGSLAVCRGAQIFALGTRKKPIIMTSENDRATWTEGPGTGQWREASNEWGNLTIMGEALISENAIGTNTATCNSANIANMEGLTNGPSTDQYGGAFGADSDDNDDSGTVQYVSLRYGGKVTGINVELNGLSLGGIGRNTDIHHIDVMNNVDDGVEIWGGTVNLKYINIWNIGDDCFDVDQGWRGKAQFLLLVQGFSTRVAQGSGTGDNVFETDGAEQSDFQPVTTAVIYNATIIGQPGTDSGGANTATDGSDHATAWRDNARIQYRNCSFLDIGDRLVSFDNVDGDGGAGYGFNGTLSWAATWTTNFNAVPPHANDCSSPSTVYQAQTSGKLAEITDCVFWNKKPTSTFSTEAIARGVLPGNGTNNNVDAGSSALTMPIRALVRDTAIDYNPGAGNLHQARVIQLDPRPANAALTSVASAPNDGFFTPANFRGAFPPPLGGVDVLPWVSGWTAADAYGFILPHKGKAGSL